MTGPAALARECRSKTSGAVSPAAPDPAVLALDAEFPGWHAWRSRTGRWWATRTGRGAQCERGGDGTPMTVYGGDEDGLRAVLAGYQKNAGA